VQVKTDLQQVCYNLLSTSWYLNAFASIVPVCSHRSATACQQVCTSCCERAAAMLFSTGLSQVVDTDTELQQCCWRQACCKPRKVPYEALCIHILNKKMAKQVAIFGCTCRSCSVSENNKTFIWVYELTFIFKLKIIRDFFTCERIFEQNSKNIPLSTPGPGYFAPMPPPPLRPWALDPVFSLSQFF
jgi:hypothetical protein